LLGRANASMNFLERGLEPVGALVGGTLGGLIGLRLTWLAAVAGILSASLWILFSPIPALRDYPAPEVEPDHEEGLVGVQVS